MFADGMGLVRRSIRGLGVAFCCAVLGGLMTVGSATASTDPNQEISLEPEHPFSQRCQRAMNTYYQEAQWFMDHPTGGIGDPDFAYHWSRLWDGWYISEMECGVDIDNTGHLGY